MEFVLVLAKDKNEALRLAQEGKGYNLSDLEEHLESDISDKALLVCGQVELFQVRLS